MCTSHRRMNRLHLLFPYFFTSCSLCTQCARPGGPEVGVLPSSCPGTQAGGGGRRDKHEPLTPWGIWDGFLEERPLQEIAGGGGLSPMRQGRDYVDAAASLRIITFCKLVFFPTGCEFAEGQACVPTSVHPRS